jgi:hypothetical protein
VEDVIKINIREIMYGRWAYLPNTVFGHVKAGLS